MKLTNITAIAVYKIELSTCKTYLILLIFELCNIALPLNNNITCFSKLCWILCVYAIALIFISGSVQA